MSLPDTAEYWQDVKRGNGFSNKHVFTHVKGLPCGHHQIEKTTIFHEVDCRACKRIIDEIPEVIEFKKPSLKTGCLNWFYLNGKKPSMVDLMTINSWAGIFTPNENQRKLIHGFKSQYNLQDVTKPKKAL